MSAAVDTVAQVSRKDAVIFGASRHGRVVLEVLRAQGRYTVVGFLDDDTAKYGSNIAGAPVLGGIGWIRSKLGSKLAGIVGIGGNDPRIKTGELLQREGVELLNAIHPSAVVMAGVKLGAGNLVGAGAVLVTGTTVEDSVVVNTAASVDHDCVLETGAYVAPGVHTAGCVVIGRGAFIGVGAIIGPGVKIGAGTLVGAGSVVLSDLPARVLAYGSPATVVKTLESAVDWRAILGGRARP